MSFRTIATVAIISLSALQPASAQSGKETNISVLHNDSVIERRYNEKQMQKAIGQSQEPRTRAQAKAKITVQSSETKLYDQTASPALMELHLNETFTGDIDGESPVRALQVQRDDKSAS